MKPSPNCGQIIWLESTQSTNDALRRLVVNLDNLSIVAAKSQTDGRGQGNHHWHSAPGENLTFSILLKFSKGSLAARDEQIINRFVVPSILEFLSGEGISATVKQPNDILVDGKKICGILVENILDGFFVKESIIGVGLNLNEKKFPSNIPNPVSLFQLTKRKYPLEKTLQRIHSICKKNWERVFILP